MPRMCLALFVRIQYTTEGTHRLPQIILLRSRIQLGLSTTKYLFDLAEYDFESGEEISGVQPAALQVRDPYFVSKKEDRRF